MTLPTLLVSWFLPLLIGSGLYALVVGWPWRNSDRLVAAGLGWIVGALMCGVLTRLLASTDPTHTLMRAGPWAAAIAALAWSVAWWRRTPPVVGALPDPVGRRWWPWALITLVLLGWRGWLIASDILLHPTLAWDAWAAWEAKAKIWVLGGQIAPFVSFSEWLAHPTQPLRTGIGYSYPDLLPWTIVWFAGPVGWIEPWINLAWFGLWIAMLLAQYGQLRALGVDRSRTWIGVYVLGSLPLLESHVALGGYADLWLAALFGQGAFAWLRWHCGGERRQLGVVLAIILLMPLIKLEGSVWSIVLASACVFSSIPRWTRRRRLLLGLGFAIALTLLSVAFSAAWIAVARRYIDHSTAFNFSDFAASLDAFGQGLWGQENWNLLWFLLPVVLLGNRVAWMRSATTRRLAVLVGVSFLLIGGLFLFTAAARYAQSYSAVNRLLLQLAPMAVALLILASRTSADSDRLRER
ncbi:MAG: hypothetical protein ABIR62_01980 [Dokdonella sp.]|uniref:hypothetical protein n=1 Tax=Dokdonella sp. TaxID=2291710 RepID=UPI00326326ED